MTTSANRNEPDSNQYTLFSVSGHYFALEIAFIKEVLDFPNYTQLPNRPAHFSGVFNLRGRIVTIIDIRYLLNLEISENELPKMIILIESEQALVAIAVDQVFKFMNIDDIHIKVPSRATPAPLAKYVSGYVENKEYGTTYVLDIEKLNQVLHKIIKQK
jgi:purine-binding chemotaxis protein CheW